MKPAAADSAVAGFVSTPAVSFCICRSTSNCGIIINFRAGIFESHVADRAPVSPRSDAAHAPQAAGAIETLPDLF